MATRIRLSTVVFVLIMLVLLGSLPYLFLFEEKFTEANVATITAVVMMILFIGGLFSIAWFTLLIRIDYATEEIVLMYPFRFQKKIFHFKNVNGFRYKYLNAKIDYKALQFSICDRIYTVSDFETSNLRQLEKISLKTFDLRGEKFRKLTDQGKKREVLISQRFDIQQAKDIRFLLILATFFCVLFYLW